MCPFSEFMNKRHIFAVTDIEMRWHEETSFQNRGVPVHYFSGARSADELDSEWKTRRRLGAFDPTNAEERQQVSRILARCRNE